VEAIVRALRAPHNWVQLARFCAVGASGYVINLAVYTALLKWAGFHYLGAEFFSILVEV
jgi:putative flippase GtrA